jgi:poly(3-hydroxybutyrate) depolymerase
MTTPTTNPSLPSLDFSRTRTPLFALQSDPRFSYCQYIPTSYSDSLTYSLLILIHDSYRDATGLRDRWSGFCEQNNVVSLAPLFPAGTGENKRSTHTYQALTDNGTRYDQLLFDMIQDAKRHYPAVDISKFFMVGFSGGGQFTHRFAYLYPERLIAVSIQAASTLTVPDDRLSWPVGIAGIEDLFQRKFDPQGLKAVRIQMLVGSQDTGLATNPGETLYPEFSRLRKTVLLADLWRQQLGVAVSVTIVPGVGHDNVGMERDAMEFVVAVLKGNR